MRAATAALHATAAMGGYRVVVIDGAERLNRNAANALLKSLEEPPPAAVLILVSHRPAQVAATLRSRCAKLPLARLPDRAGGRTAWRAGRRSSTTSSAARSRCSPAAASGRALALAGADWLPLYQRLAASLNGAAADRPGAPRSVARAGAPRRAARLRRPARRCIQELLGRVVAAGAGRPGPPLFAGEAEALDAAGPPAPP